ncbi:GNAT family N-acetyltransferase [Neobacillus sp. PS3-34]|uniref:GNAT family N-acetyltransferase n=1 Tax=Neobacillus sp. PS3-34 TaxID=3070678 RepID=UPI0027E13119|nr:GNAT family N-acetyltransferase [Neobacillus sp. PS3-34]WML48020.1 GNAT family N-acetyltransferase [Neobacillus sp. PS3-34]
MDIKFKRLVDCIIQESVNVWNRGFEGYFVPIDMSADMFVQRLINEGLSMEHSIVAFDNEKPVAIVLNGFRTVNEKKISWNGGTGVAMEYRGTGVSKLLMEETIKIYAEESTDVATLEAIKQNEKAIRLYEKYGYKVIGNLVYLSGNPEIQLNNTQTIRSRTIRPEQLPSYAFHSENVPWQCQWQSVKQGEAQVYYNEEDNPIGYSLYRKSWNQEGKLDKVFLFQIELFEEVSESLVGSILSSITGQEGNSVNFITINASENNPVIQYFIKNGFKITTEQVQMVKYL